MTQQYRKRCRRRRFDPWVRKIPWRRKWQPTPVFLPEKMPQIVEPGGLQFMGSQRVRHDWATEYRSIKTDENFITAPYCNLLLLVIVGSKRICTFARYHVKIKLKWPDLKMKDHHVNIWFKDFPFLGCPIHNVASLWSLVLKWPTFSQLRNLLWVICKTIPNKSIL